GREVVGSGQATSSSAIMRIVTNLTKSVLVLAVLSAVAPLHAQEPAAVRKIALPNLDSQVAAKLAALDLTLNPVHSPELAARMIADIAAGSPYGAFNV